MQRLHWETADRRAIDVIVFFVVGVKHDVSLRPTLSLFLLFFANVDVKLQCRREFHLPAKRAAAVYDKLHIMYNATTKVL